MSIQNSQQISDIKTMLVKGMNGEGIESIEKTATEGFIDTYTITYTDGTKTTFDVTNGNWGIWTSAVTAAVSATSVTINNDAIGTTSILEVYSQNASGTVITVNDIDVTPGAAVLTFPALAEATDFILHIVNGTASGGGGGGGGTTDYLDLSNKPQINGNTLTGNKTSGDLGIPNIFQGTIAEWNQLSTAEKKAYDHASIPDSIDGGVTFPANKVIMTGGGNVEDAIDVVSGTFTADANVTVMHAKVKKQLNIVSLDIFCQKNLTANQWNHVGDIPANFAPDTYNIYFPGLNDTDVVFFETRIQATSIDIYPTVSGTKNFSLVTTYITAN